VTVMLAAAEAEVHDLHRFLEGWLTGTLAPDARTFARFADCLGVGFRIISPAGQVTDREALCRELHAAHGARAGADTDFRIWIEHFRDVQEWPDHCLIAYQEWQHFAGRTTARISTTLFGRRQDAADGVAWLHLHETWLAGHGPDA